MKRLYDLANLTLLLLLGALAYQSYPKLPARVPMHFNRAGEVDRWDSREGLIVLLFLPAVLTAILYLVTRAVPGRRSAARLNIPHKAEFLKLPAEKQEIFWALMREFLAGLAAAMNLVFYVFNRGLFEVALGRRSLLPLKPGLGALALTGVLMVYYLWRMTTLPGKLVRGEE